MPAATHGEPPSSSGSIPSSSRACVSSAVSGSAISVLGDVPRLVGVRGPSARRRARARRSRTRRRRRWCDRSSASSRSWSSRELCTEIHSPIAIEHAPAIRPATPVTRMSFEATPAPATPIDEARVGDEAVVDAEHGGAERVAAGSAPTLELGQRTADRLAPGVADEPASARACRCSSWANVTEPARYDSVDLGLAVAHDRARRRFRRSRAARRHRMPCARRRARARPGSTPASRSSALPVRDVVMLVVARCRRRSPGGTRRPRPRRARGTPPRRRSRPVAPPASARSSPGRPRRRSSRRSLV